VVNELAFDGFLFYVFLGSVLLIACAAVLAVVERFGKDEGQG